MDKKELIVHAAIKAFQEKGIDKTTVSDIVKGAGIAQGTFYLYFPSKLSVMPAIAEVMVKKMIAEIEQNVQGDTLFSKKLSQVIDAIFTVTRDYQEIIALIYAGLAGTDHLKQWEAVYEPVYSWMSKFLLEAQASGVIRESLHVEQTSKLMIGLIESAAEQIYLYDTKDDKHALIQKDEVLDFSIHALGLNE